jgi:hypothetical protein
LCCNPILPSQSSALSDRYADDRSAVWYRWWRKAFDPERNSTEVTFTFLLSTVRLFGSLSISKYLPPLCHRPFIFKGCALISDVKKARLIVFVLKISDCGAFMCSICSAETSSGFLGMECMGFTYIIHNAVQNLRVSCMQSAAFLSLRNLWLSTIESLNG